MKNTANVLDFMLHRVLSMGSVKTVCCHNTIPHTLRGDLTCGSFQFYICRLNLKQTWLFTSYFQKKFVLTLTEEIISQSKPEKQDKNQNS